MFKYPIKTNKYHNKKVVIDNIAFDSELEATRYTELKLLEHKGLIKDWVLQPSYDLIPSFKKGNKTYHKTTYRTDFSYYDNELSKTIVEDTKGFNVNTNNFILRYKLNNYHIRYLYR